MNRRNWRYSKGVAVLIGVFLSSTLPAQCPVNIGFEQGSFANWECSAGMISKIDGTITLNPSGPITGQHTLFPNSYPQALDKYGLFPVNCPNGSGYSIRLGNNTAGGEAEQVAYTFTIPKDQNNYSIIYNYAVVLQNPDHSDWQQPKFTANVFDASTNNYIGCSSFSYTAGADLPGFKLSVTSPNTAIYYKPWTPVTIKLSGYAGRTIRLEFTTNDCSVGGHFGYAYVDVNEDCSSPIKGNVFCINDTTQTLTAPYGFASYRWFNSDFSKILGTDIDLTFNPIPPPNKTYAVEVTPYPDQGCIDTVYTTTRFDGVAINVNIPVNSFVSCANGPIDLTNPNIVTGSTPQDLAFSYYTDKSQTSFVPTPRSITANGVYYIRATNTEGCHAAKPVTLRFVPLPDFKVTDPPNVTRPNSTDLSSVITSNLPGTEFSFWKDSLATIPLRTAHAINQDGRYFIKGTQENLCSVTEAVNVVIKEPPLFVPNAFSPNGDGVHDTWEIPILALYPACTVEIFNRLGQSLYKSTGYNKPWDGKYNGADLPISTYYYIIWRADNLPISGGSVTIVR